METEVERRRRREKSRVQKLNDMKTYEFIFVLGLFGAFGMGFHLGFEMYSPGPYMDEVFHVPQAQKYCDGQFDEWDPKITTLPGTYIMTAAVLRSTGFIYGVEEPCSIVRLRAFSLVVSAFNLIMIFLIIGAYSPELTIPKRALSAMNIATFPVLYFFSFLYYTDAVSTAALLLMHFFCLNECFRSSAVAGAFAVLTRQTNIVWVMYHGIFSLLSVMLDKYGSCDFDYPEEFKRFIRGDGQKIKKAKPSKLVKRSSASRTTPSMDRIWRECGTEFVARGYPYVLVGIAFFVFVVHNGSIVVGDKEAHQATLNMPQMGYFTLVFGAFTFPFLLCRIDRVLKKLKEFPYSTGLLAIVMAVIIFVNTPVHPYLLADNRHYTFYVWKRFFEAVPCYRYLWIPIYIVMWVFISMNFGLSNRIFFYAYLSCTMLNLVPQLLLEFRYFIPAYLFARMSFRNASWLELVFEFCISNIVNLFTMHLFYYRTFKWPDSDDVQHFMW